MSLFFVFLRRPRHLGDRRNDPFWEFGSFGKTGCHKSNLLHPRLTPIRKGDRLAFLQGGNREIRIVGVTPPVDLAIHGDRVELNWTRSYRPLPYSDAALLINNAGKTDFPVVLAMLQGTKRSTYCGAAGSKFRSSKSPVDSELSKGILRWFSRAGLPEARAYFEAVAPSGAWLQHAQSERWATRKERLRQYESIETALPHVSGRNAKGGRMKPVSRKDC